MIESAIFDLDGTLFDSMGVWEKIDRDFLEKRGLPFSEFEIKDLTSRSFQEVAEYVIKQFHLPETTGEIIAEWNAMALYEYSHNIRMKPHAKAYLLGLKNVPLKLAIATSLPQALYEPLLQNNGLEGVFDAFCSTDEVSRGKDYPDVYLLAAERIGTEPKNCVVFEDILSGVRSAKGAGMQVYGIYDAYSKNDAAAIEVMADGFLQDFSEAPSFR